MAKCVGCGIKLQSVDESVPGFVPLGVTSDLGEKSYCKRCYQIIHNGLKYDPLISDTDYYKMIDVIKTKKALVVLMIDVLNIYSGFIPNLSKHIGDNEVVILVNKIDLLPKDIHLNLLENRIRELAMAENLKVAGVIMISAKKKKNVEAVLSKINYIQKNVNFKANRYHHNKVNVISEFYVLGCASVGKSTFINTIKDLYLDDKTPITTSNQMQTTLSFIKVPLDQYNFLIDTPGLINYHMFDAYLGFDSMQKITPKSYLKPRTYQLKPDQTIFMGGLCQLDFVQGTKITVSFYVSNDLYLHRTKTINADNIRETQMTKLLVPPTTLEEVEKLSKLKTKEYLVNEGAYDLLIGGLGFVHIVGENIKFKVTINENIDVKLVETFI